MLMAYRIDVVTTVSSFLFPFQIFFKISFFLFGSCWNAEQRRMSEEGENTICTDSSRQQSSQVSSSQLVCGSCGGVGHHLLSFLELLRIDLCEMNTIFTRNVTSKSKVW